MKILAIDPGPEQSASVWLVNGLPHDPEKQSNESLLDWLISYQPETGDVLAIEMIASYGMAVGREVFETCVWIGRFAQAWHNWPFHFIYRRDVKVFLCQSARATDSNIRAALIDMYGGSKLVAIGNKRTPGPLYGLKGDTWSALAVALTAAHQIKQEVERAPLPQLQNTQAK
jgi:hypothetical protein